MSRRILLADDSLTIQKVVELTFADTDYEVIAVSSGDDLLAQLPEAKPDVVICDVIMPGRDGYDVCQEIKSNPDFLHLPVVLLTGTFEPFDRDRALAVGCSEIITKPFEAKRLVEAVELLASGGAASNRSVESATAAEAIAAENGAAVAEFGDGQVTPPPPFEAAEEPADAEPDFDLADTAVTANNDTVDSTATETVETAFDAPEEGLDFTKSGFQAMEAAGLEEDGRSSEVPADGLEFTPGPDPMTEPEAAPDAAAGFVVETPPADPDPEPAVEEVDTSPENPFAAAETDDAPAPVEPPDDDPFPAFAEPDTEPADEPDQAMTTPIDVDLVMSEAEDTSPVPEDFLASEPEPEPEPEPHAEPQPEPELEDQEAWNAETQDFGQPSDDQPEPQPVADPALTDEDVDRIARRVLELSGEKIDRIAWEVLPDMAEIVVRERVREIEAEAEKQGS